METLLQYERQSSVAISICVMYIARPYMAGFHHVLLLLSNKEGRKWKYELMKSFSFPHTTLGWDDVRFFTSKTSLSGTNQNFSGGNPKESYAHQTVMLNRQQPYCKVSNELCLCDARGGGKKNTLPCQTNTEGTVGLALFTFKSFNLLLIDT